MIRPLKASDVEARVARVSEKGCSLLVYKTARCDMSILDEDYGPFGWQRSHEIRDGRLYCTVSVKDPETGEWVSKEDVGTESNQEPEKGQASDAFKRACFNWGIGRELYTAPFIWIPANKCNVTQNKGRWVCYDRFDVTGLESDGGVITRIEISRPNGQVVYQWSSGARNQKNALEGDTGASDGISAQDMTDGLRLAVNKGIKMCAEKLGMEDGQVRTAVEDESSCTVGNADDETLREMRAFLMGVFRGEISITEVD